MVRIHPDPPVRRQQASGPGCATQHRALWQARQDGAVAQLGERLLCKQEAVGSIPSSSTSIRTIDCQGSIQAWPCGGERLLGVGRVESCGSRSLTIRKARRAWTR
jgi:hypothetical protein